mgnify:CR=1 FL=1
MIKFSETKKFSHMGQEYEYSVAEFHGYNVFKITTLDMFPMASYTPINNYEQPAIFVPAVFDQFSEKMQRFFLYHELGHIVNNHVPVPTQEMMEKIHNVSYQEILQTLEQHLLSEEVDPNELIADEYAAEHCGVGDVIDSLKDAIGILEEINQGIVQGEFLGFDEQTKKYLIETHNKSIEELKNA